MENRDSKERKQIEDDLYGWSERNEQANKVLLGGG